MGSGSDNLQANTHLLCPP